MKDIMEQRKNIINHIKRLEGQLASVRSELSAEAPDCEKASATMLSASRSFAGLRQKFVELFLQKYFIDTVKDKNMFDKLLSIIRG